MVRPNKVRNNFLNDNVGRNDGSGIGLIEEEVSEGSELGVFSFEGTQIGGDLINPEEAGSLPESIENPER